MYDADLFLKKKKHKQHEHNHALAISTTTLFALKFLDIYIKFINVVCCFEIKFFFPIYQRHRLGTFHNRRRPLPRGVERSKWRRGTGKAHRHLPATGYTPLTVNFIVLWLLLLICLSMNNTCFNVY